MENIREDILEKEKDTVRGVGLMIGIFRWLNWSDEKGYTDSERAFIYFTLFMVVLIVLVATTPVICKCFPNFDYSKMIQLAELNESRMNDKFSIDIVDSGVNPSLVHLIGVYNPTELFLTIYGFSCSYQNYIRSTSFKFT